MANTYSSNLRLIIQTTSENAGTWGIYTNTNIATLLEQAITGIGAIAVSGATNYTLSTANGASDESRNAILNVTGTLTAAINIVCPTVSKTYIIKNGTTGGYAVTLKTSAGTGISVPNGSTMFLYCDGTNVVEAVNYQTSGKFSSLTDTGLTSGRVTYAGTGGLLQDSTNLTFDGTTLTAGGLATAGNLTLSGGTANGVLYLNGSKVATSGSALTFDGTNLGIGTATTSPYRLNLLRSDGKTFFATDGATADFAITCISGVSTVATASTSALAFGLAGSEQMRLTSTGLGIGTSSPGYKLTVGTAVSNYGFTHTDGTRTVGSYVDTNGGWLGTISNHNLNLFTNSGGAAVTVTTSGNLGLGVTPSGWANTKAMQFTSFGAMSVDTAVDGNFSSSWNAYATGASAWKYTNTGLAASKYTQVYGQHQWFTAPSGTAGNAISFTQAMTLDASGRLLIGTATGASGVSIQASFVNSSGGGIQIGGPTSGGAALVGNTSGGLLFFAYAGAQGSEGYTERMRIDSSGNLLVGTTSTSLTSGWLVYGATGEVNMRRNSDGAAYVFNRSGTTVGSITVSSSATAYNTSSDQRLKTDLGIATSTDVIDNTKIHDFEWKTDGSKSRGVFAQEAKLVKPEAVTEGNDELGNDGLPINPWGVDYSKYVPDLIVYCQQLKARISQLESQLGK